MCIRDRCHCEETFLAGDSRTDDRIFVVDICLVLSGLGIELFQERLFYTDGNPDVYKRQVVVTGYGPGKAIYTKGDVVVSSEDFQNANVENGECILFDYSIDYGVANNMGAGTDTSYTEAIIYENTISEVNRWNFYNTLTDTSIVAKDELLLSSLQARSAYIRGNLFLFTEISNHPANQVDS